MPLSVTVQPDSCLGLANEWLECQARVIRRLNYTLHGQQGMETGHRGFDGPTKIFPGECRCTLKT